MRTTVARLLEHKGHTVWTIRPDASVYEALKLMAEKGIGALVVVDGDRAVGMVSERDYARKIALLERFSAQTRVEEIMTSIETVVHKDHTTGYCMELITERRVRHLPVFEDERLVGLVSIGDVVRAVISEQEFLIQQLEAYIHR